MIDDQNDHLTACKEVEINVMWDFPVCVCAHARACICVCVSYPGMQHLSAAESEGGHPPANHRAGCSAWPLTGHFSVSSSHSVL